MAESETAAEELGVAPLAEQAEQIEIPEAVALHPADQRFEKMATISGKKTEVPSLILKLKNGGELWLSGIPTERGCDRFPLAPLQVVCFPESPVSRGGVELHGAKLRHICVAHADRRDREWQRHWPLIRNTLFQGQTVLVHCTAGRHRAVVVAVMIVAIMCRISLGQAHARVLQRRPIQLEQAFKDDDLSKWAHAVVRNTKLANPWPKSEGWICTERSQTHVMTYEGGGSLRSQAGVEPGGPFAESSDHF